MNLNLKKTTINSLLIAIGFMLHQFIPPIFFGMKPDISLIIMFIIILLNKEYKTTVITGILCGILSAITSTFPGGQPANFIEKFLTANIIYILYMPFRHKSNSKLKIGILTFIGTILSGLIFITTASILISLPIKSITPLFLAVVLPTTVINTIVAPIIFNIVISSLKRSNINIF